MNRLPSLKKNFAMNAVLSLSALVFPILSYPYVSRVLHPYGVGTVSFATSVIAYFNIIAQLGIPTYGIRACAQVRDNREELSRTVHELAMINLATVLAAYAALAACIAMIPRLNGEKALLSLVSISMLLNMAGMEWLFKGLEEYTYIAVRSIAFKAIALAAMFLLIHEQDDYLIYGGISVLAASGSNLVNLIRIPRLISLKPVGNYRPMRHLKMVFIFFAMACATTVYTNLDAVMLGMMKTNEDVGLYDAAVKVKGILVSLVTSLGVVMLPRTSYFVGSGKIEEFWEISKKALNFVILAAAPIVMYFVFFAKEGILFLSGPDFAGSVQPMRIIMPTVLLIGMTNILGIQILVPLGREKEVLYSVIAGALVDLLLNSLLIPRYASSGAAFGTLIAESVVLAFQCFALRKHLKTLFQTVRTGRILLALILATLSVSWAGWWRTGPIGILLVTAVLFFGSYAACLLLMREPIVTEVWGQIRGKFRGIRS